LAKVIDSCRIKTSFCTFCVWNNCTYIVSNTDSNYCFKCARCKGNAT